MHRSTFHSSYLVLAAIQFRMHALPLSNVVFSERLIRHSSRSFLARIIHFHKPAPLYPRYPLPSHKHTNFCRLNKIINAAKRVSFGTFWIKTYHYYLFEIWTANVVRDAIVRSMWITNWTSAFRGLKSNWEYSGFCDEQRKTMHNFRMNFRFLSQRALALVWILGVFACERHMNRMETDMNSVLEYVLFSLVCLVDATSYAVQSTRCWTTANTYSPHNGACTSRSNISKNQMQCEFVNARRHLSSHTTHSFNGFLHLSENCVDSIQRTLPSRTVFTQILCLPHPSMTFVLKSLRLILNLSGCHRSPSSSSSA